MKQAISLWQLWGFAVTSFAGTLLHFLYDWTNQSIFAAPISAVNESTWEHMKLLFFPMFIFAIIQRKFSADRSDFWCVKLIGISTGLIAIPALFYTYNGAIGKSPDWINITIFFVAAALAYWLELRLFLRAAITCRYPRLAFLLICMIAVMFVLFTFFPPHILLFLDPITGLYGIST